MLAIVLPEDLQQRLTELAHRTGRTETSFAQEAIVEHLEDLEDLYLAEQQLSDIRKGQLKTVPLEQVVKRYGLED